MARGGFDREASVLITDGAWVAEGGADFGLGELVVLPGEIDFEAAAGAEAGD